MKRLTTDNPKDNIENALNLFYGKDQWTWVRGYGPAPDCADIGLCDLVRMIVKANIPDAELPEDDDALSELMCEWLMYEPTTAEGIISLLYTAGWAFAELRHRLAAYEDLEEQGHLMELPCKVGDTVYISGHEYAAQIDEIVIKANGGITFFWLEYDRGPELEELWDYGEFTPEDIGKIVFLTREEAERALAGGADHA
ncbi:MAG: hypothetical protein IKB79_04875 [Oscillospiraceae bacterium]|nr:hypothetical protein [Oscillospiraceae bacterium]